VIKDYILPLLIIVGGLILYILTLPTFRMDETSKLISIICLVIGTLFFLLMDYMDENKSNEQEIKSLNNELEKLRPQKKKILKKNKSNPKSSR